MPKVKLTANDRRNELFKKQHKIDKAILNKKDYDFAEELGICKESMSRRMQNPVRYLMLKEWIHLAATWPDDVILQFVKGK